MWIEHWLCSEDGAFKEALKIGQLSFLSAMLLLTFDYHLTELGRERACE